MSYKLIWLLPPAALIMSGFLYYNEIKDYILNKISHYSNQSQVKTLTFTREKIDKIKNATTKQVKSKLDTTSTFKTSANTTPATLISSNVLKSNKTVDLNNCIATFDHLVDVLKNLNHQAADINCKNRLFAEINDLFGTLNQPNIQLKEKLIVANRILTYCQISSKFNLKSLDLRKIVKHLIQNYSSNNLNLFEKLSPLPNKRPIYINIVCSFLEVFSSCTDLSAIILDASRLNEKFVKLLFDYNNKLEMLDREDPDEFVIESLRMISLKILNNISSLINERLISKKDDNKVLLDLYKVFLNEAPIKLNFNSKNEQSELKNYHHLSLVKNLLEVSMRLAFDGIKLEEKMFLYYILGDGFSESLKIVSTSSNNELAKLVDQLSVLVSLSKTKINESKNAKSNEL